MRTILLGLDAFDPRLFEGLCDQGLMPNLAKYTDSGRYARFQISNPPQSEVSWTSIATGLNPGQHGLYDFVHRVPGTYSLYVSLLPTREGLGGTQFVRPYHARTIFDQVAERGYPATTLWWPATFPARPESPVRTLPGLGTPDVQGRLGVGVLYTTDPDLTSPKLKTRVEILKATGGDRFIQQLAGPVRQAKSGPEVATLPFQLQITDDASAMVRAGDQLIDLQRGRWSPIVTLNYKLGPFFSALVVTRLILTQIKPDIRLYFLPLQLHPLKSLWRYASPGGFVKDIWHNRGPFLTLGWPQDTNGLEDGFISDGQFLELCRSIDAARANVLFYQLASFQEGILGAVFDTLDRVQHMFLKSRPDVVREWYVKLDALVGQVESYMPDRPAPDDRLVVVSDHGFADFSFKVHLNRWLIAHGYLAAHQAPAEGSWQDIEWPRTRAYAIGLNSVYLNLAGREAQGQVHPHHREAVLAELETGLIALQGPDGRQVVQKVWRKEEAFPGSTAEDGPDLIIGYSDGYRASSETGLGGWGAGVIEPNRDHWNADHCINPLAVPGVLFSNRDLTDLPHPSYRDIPFLTINGTPEAGDYMPPTSLSEEEEEVVMERLKGLGYF